MTRLARFAWFTLVWNVGVILWGAAVRATGSGAGCGASWPTCQGQILPELEGATRLEFGHRAVSGIALLLVAILAVRVFRTFPAGHPARTGAVWSGAAIIGEALIGAAIVLYEWVAEDASVGRAVSVPLHLVNTLLLLAALTLTIFWIKGGGRLSVRGRGREARVLGLVALGLVLIAATGAITALADTLFPKESFTAGLASDLAGEESFLTRLRILHPIVAIAAGLVAAWFARREGFPAGGSSRIAGRIVIWTVVAQYTAGFLNVALGTPLWLSLTHLALADVLWVAFVWLAAEVLSRPVRLSSAGAVADSPAG
ncbi:MAG: COX15/CtaA family protein [Acidimicrobiia bacterium]